MSDSLRLQRLQHSRLPGPSLTAGVCSDSCSLHWWCLPTISPSVTPVSSCLQSFTVSESFPMSQLFPLSCQSIGASASASVLPMNTQDRTPLGWTGISLEGMMLKLKLQYFGHLMGRVDSLENRGWDGWMASLTQWMWVWVNSRSWWWTGRPGVLVFMGSQRVGHDWATELNWNGEHVESMPWALEYFSPVSA